MGTQKLLLPLGSSTVIGMVVDQFLGARGAEIEIVNVVVSNHAGSGEAIAKALAGCSITIVENPDPQAEMLSSARCGLKALSADCEAAIVALGDQPAVRSELIDQLVAAFQASGKGIVVPVHGGKRGHPLLIAARYFTEVQESYDSIGLRGLIKAHPTDIFEIQCDNSAVLDDVDVPADYLRELNRQPLRG